MLSVVTICRNSSSTIGRTLQSVNSQVGVLNRTEHIVIDGSSNDDTLTIVRQFDGVRVVSEPDDGIADAFNKGMRLAKGKYIQYLNADDYLNDRYVLRDVLDFIAVQNEPEWVVGDIMLNRNGRLATASNRVPISCWSMMFYCRIPHPAVFLQRKALLDLGGFNTEYKVSMDYDLWQRLCVRGYRPIHLKRVIAVFSTQGLSAQMSPVQMAERQSIRYRFRNTLLKRMIGAAYDFVKSYQ